MTPASRVPRAGSEPGAAPVGPSLLPLFLRLYAHHWRRLLFFSSCIAVGVAFLVGVESVLSSVQRAVAARARKLMAGDVELAAYRPFTPAAEAAFRRLETEGHRAAAVVSFSSMARAEGGDPFLVGVKAAGDLYPLYGELETSPAGVRPKGLECLLDEDAARLHGIAPGDRLRLGDARLRVAALLLKEPDRTLGA